MLAYITNQDADSTIKCFEDLKSITIKRNEIELPMIVFEIKRSNSKKGTEIVMGHYSEGELINKVFAELRKIFLYNKGLSLNICLPLNDKYAVDLWYNELEKIVYDYEHPYYYPSFLFPYLPSPRFPLF